MWYEKLDYKVDIEKLRQEVKDSVFTLGDEFIQGAEFESGSYRGFGGWSLQSRMADWRDGWEAIQTPQGFTLESFLPTQELISKALKHFNIAHGLEHDKGTQAYVGEIKKVLDDLKEMGFNPCRSRVTGLKPGCKSLVHRDSDTTEYMARIHIPLWTNEKCVHICLGEHLHMPADGSVYILWVNQWHQIRNDSSDTRFHIIMDAYDTKHITENFKYMGNFEELQKHVLKMREMVDAVEVTEDDAYFFEQLKARYVTNANV